MPIKLRRLLPCFAKSRAKGEEDEGIEITRLSSTTTSPNPLHQLHNPSPSTPSPNGPNPPVTTPAQTTWPYRGSLKPPPSPLPDANTNNTSTHKDTDIDAITPIIRPRPSYSNIKLAAEDRRKLFEMLRDPEKAPVRKASHGVLAGERAMATGGENGDGGVRRSGEVEWEEIVKRGKDGGEGGGCERTNGAVEREIEGKGVCERPSVRVV